VRAFFDAVSPAAFVFVAAFALTFQVRTHASHQWGCYHLQNYKVALYNGATGDYYNIFQETAVLDSQAWSPFTAMQIFYPYTSQDYQSPGWQGIAGFNGYYGTTGWAGLATLTNTSGCLVYAGKAELNQTYLDSTSRDYKKYAACQEVGHLFGLDHNRSDSTTCMNDVTQSSSVPNTHDQDELSAIYGYVPPTCTSCSRVTLQASDGYLVQPDGAGCCNVHAIGTGTPDMWDTLRLIDLGGGNIGLQADNGQYLCAEGGGGREVVANRNAIGPWETFALIQLGGGYVALQANNGQYVTSEIGSTHQVNANRAAIGPWETFYLSYLP
jgi:hypothetical protein